MARLHKYEYVVKASGSDVTIPDLGLLVTSSEMDLLDTKNYYEIKGSQDLQSAILSGTVALVLDSLPTDGQHLCKTGVLDGDTFLFVYDAIRDMWVSSSEMVFAFAENKISKNDWFLNQNNAIDREMARGCKHNLIVTGFRAQCENAGGNTKAVHIYKNSEDDGVLWTTDAQTNYQEVYVRELNMTFTKGDHIRLRGDSNRTVIQDTDIVLYYRYVL